MTAASLVLALIFLWLPLRVRGRRPAHTPSGAGRSTSARGPVWPAESGAVSARGIIVYRPGGPTTGLPHEWILALKQVVVCLCFLVAVACGGGGSSSPTAPTPTPTPPPPPPPPPTAQLQSTGRPSFTSCVAILGTCYLDWSIQNVGPGCAVQTTAVARLYDAADAQVGSDVQMGSVQVGLSSRTIRPNEIVSITSTRGIERQFVDRTERVRLFPTWSNAACP